MNKKILVTGAAGYIGSELCRQLLENGYKVRGLDSLLFGGDSLLPLISNPDFEFIKGDIRDQEMVKKSLAGVDAVVHLAAIVGDPACKAQPELASETMDTATKMLYHHCADSGISHFVFASTCSNYGVMENDRLLDENAPLSPQSHYARLKVGFEEYLIENEVVPRTILRFSTVYGLSPRIRFDLTVNHFTRDLGLGKELLVFGENTWRPYCHVTDLARSVVKVLESGNEKMNGMVFNVGDSAENYSKRMIIQEILKMVPDGKVKYGEGKGDDPRNYRVDFSRINEELGFRISKTVPMGIEEVLKLVRSGLIHDLFAEKYRNC